MERSDYRRVNEAFRRRMVYHVGVDCGLFVEINYMVNAMLYCLARRISFQLYSDDANFGTGIGWREYFLPFCEEVHEPFHRQYNFHRPPSWRRILKLCRRQKAVGPIAWKLKSIQKTAMGHVIALLTYKEYVLLGQDVSDNPDHYYRIPELGIDADYTETYGLLARMVFRFNPSMQRQATLVKSRLSIPALYDGIHIRGGDKITETDLISGKRVMKVLNPKAGACVFVLTDDYRQYQELQTNYPYVHFLTLCQPEERGYLHKAFIQKSSQSRQESIIRLLISVDLLLHSRSFVGSITTGPSAFVLKQRAADPHVQAVDCPKEDLSSSLSLTIDLRAAISKKNLKEQESIRLGCFKSNAYLCSNYTPHGQRYKPSDGALAGHIRRGLLEECEAEETTLSIKK